MELSKSEDHSNDRNSSNMDAVHGRSKFTEGHKSHNTLNNGFVNMHNAAEFPCSLPVSDTLDVLSPELSDAASKSHEWPRSSVTRSRTHECVRGMGLQQAESKEGTNRCHHHKLVTSVTFSGYEAPLRLLRENPDASASSHEIIDYRNLTPQVPFVPCIAKSIPKKRISLRKPRKAFTDLFVHKRHKHEKAMSPSTQCPVAVKNVPTLKQTKRFLRHRERATAGSRYTDELSESLSDTSGEYCANVCEDAASLKSFGSQAGCGEIFADEEYLVSLDGVVLPERNKNVCEPQKGSPSAAGFQGGEECLASPAHAEVPDMFGIWETPNRTILFGESSKSTTETTTPITKSPSTAKSDDDIANSHVESQIRELSTDMVTPKSDSQENTSDEGYCDYLSPGFEDHSKGSLTPVHSMFPRDTYSGDALYELFYDPSEAEMTPVFDDETDLTHSLVGQCRDLPLSMYSFHVGAEENLAPPLARDFIGQELLQSSWMGKDCLLKLCDTEISLAMGIVNWLKQKTVKGNPTEMRCSQNSNEETSDLCLRDKTQSGGVKKQPIGSPPRTGNGSRDALCLKEKHSSQPGVAVPLMDLPSQFNVKTVTTTLASPESQPKTPTSGVCFRIFNIDSPMSPSGDLLSPVVSSPGSRTRSLFVLAINKESLCESCRSSLKNGAKNLYLCHSCMSLIEHIKTSDLWASKTVFSQPVTRDLPLSPASTCGIKSDISIASLVEQCASQLSSMKINITQKHLSCERRGAFEPEEGVKRTKEHSQKYLKSKHKKRQISTKETDLPAQHCLTKSSLSEDVQKPSLLETEGLGFVTTNGSNDLVLERYKSPGSIESANTDTSPATRPTSLPLMEFSCREDLYAHKIEERNPVKKKQRSRHLRKSGNSEGSCGFVFPVERKVERRSRMKK